MVLYDSDYLVNVNSFLQGTFTFVYCYLNCYTKKEYFKNQYYYTDNHERYLFSIYIFFQISTYLYTDAAHCCLVCKLNEYSSVEYGNRLYCKFWFVEMLAWFYLFYHKTT